MTSKRTSKRDVSVRGKVPVGLVFCEDSNDAISLANLAHALNGSLPEIRHCKKPLILMKGRAQAEARKRNADLVHAVVVAKKVTNEVRFVIAHQDCDAIEPNHVTLAGTIRAELGNAGVLNVVAVAPAWEIEAWWFLWPDAVSAVHSKWRKLKRRGNHGMIANAKEVLRRDLRAPGARDYEESDCGAISANIRRMGIVRKQTGTSNSFRDYAAQIDALR